jgi:chlorite dismutase
MTTTPLAPLVIDGWYLLHQFFRVTSEPVEEFDAPDAPGSRLPEALATHFQRWSDLGEGGWSGLYRVVGGRGTDYMAIHFRPSLEELAAAEDALRSASFGGEMELLDDYLSVVELGFYALTDALLKRAIEEGIEPQSEGWAALVEEVLQEERGKRYVGHRLCPAQPEEMPYVCFYPMDKRRQPGQNWYAIPLEERARLMVDHGKTGRRYAGRISQIISGSVGFDDWEWGVTLFGGNPLDFKALITEMRYDEVSALYAEFGSFKVGYRVPTDRIRSEVSRTVGRGE